MKNYYVLLMLGGSLLFFSCKKEPLPTLPEGNNPIYTMNGIVDEDSIQLNVGQESVIINYGTDEEFSMTTYYGQMESVLDNQKLRIEFVRQERPFNGNDIEVIKSNSIPFLVHEKGKVSFDFGGVGNQINNFQLRDKNGFFVNTNVLELSNYGVYTIAAKLDDYGQQIFEFDVKHGYDNQTLKSDYNVEGSENQIFISANQVEGRHEWFINSNLVGTDSNYVGFIQDGVYQIVHNVFDQNNNISTTSGLVRFKGGKNFWVMKMNYLPEYSFESYNYGRVIVSYSKDDVWYSSAYALSNKEQFMNVSEVTYVIDEETGKKLVSFDFDYSAKLYNEDLSDSLDMIGMNGKFLIGLP